MAATATRKPGRPLKANSVKMSESMFKARYVRGEKLSSIAARYEKSQGRPFTPQAIQGRLDRFRAKFPAKVEAILGAIEVAAPVAAETVEANAELVTA